VEALWVDAAFLDRRRENYTENHILHELVTCICRTLLDPTRRYSTNQTAYRIYLSPEWYNNRSKHWHWPRLAPQ